MYNKKISKEEIEGRKTVQSILIGNETMKMEKVKC